MNYSPAKTLILFFIGLIAAGTLLLSLPVSLTDHNNYSFITSLFTSTSASCVTGLTLVPINEYYSLFGQIVILLLMQLGGVGYMFVSTVVMLLIGRMALKDRRIMQEMFDISSFNDLKKLLVKAVIFVLAIEVAGAIALTGVFTREFPFLKAVYLGIFHSVSAFCNAGFSLFPDSFAGYAYHPAALYTIAALILLGGLGFFVIVDLYDAYKNKHIHLLTHTKVVLSLTVVMTIAGFALFMFSELNGALEGHGFWYMVNNSVFQSVSARGAGFVSVPVPLYNEFTRVVISFLMSVGAAPGSTAGGVKLTTIAIVFIFVRSIIKSKDDFVIFERRIPVDLVRKAIVIFILFFTAAAVLSAVMVLSETDKRTLDVIFEAVSAFGTAGLSTGITPHLTLTGKIFAIVAMLAGRIGIISVLIFMLSSAKSPSKVKYPESRILVG